MCVNARHMHIQWNFRQCACEVNLQWKLRKSCTCYIVVCWSMIVLAKRIFLLSFSVLISSLATNCRSFSVLRHKCAFQSESDLRLKPIFYWRLKDIQKCSKAVEKDLKWPKWLLCWVFGIEKLECRVKFQNSDLRGFAMLLGQMNQHSKSSDAWCPKIVFLSLTNRNAAK